MTLANIKVLDVSYIQNDIDYQAVKDSDIKGVILRCGVTTWGDLVQYPDRSFEKHYEGFRAVGMPLGAYYYSAAPNREIALREANYTAQLLKGKQFEYPIFYDVENAEQQGNLSKRQLTDIILTYLEELKKLGYYPGLYVSKYWATTKVCMNEIQDAIWIAQYNDVSTYPGRKDMWQYTNAGRVSGIQQNVDLSECYVDFPSIIRNSGLNGFPASETGQWKQNEHGWWYEYPDGSYVKDEWKKINGHWYYFDQSGYMQTGWLQLHGVWYYLEENGEMAVGWQEIQGKWYYFDTLQGNMKTGWLYLDYKWYYLDENGVMQTGLTMVEGKLYYLQPDGVLLQNQKLTLYADADGVLHV